MRLSFTRIHPRLPTQPAAKRHRGTAHDRGHGRLRAGARSVRAQAEQDLGAFG